MACKSTSKWGRMPAWRPGLALLLAVATTTVTPGRAQAQNFPASVVQIGAWTLVATAVDRKFQACTIRRVQHDGFIINVGLNFDGTQFLAIGSPQWTLVRSRTYPTSLRIGSRTFDVMGMATDARVLMLEPPVDFFVALKSGQQINVTANQHYFPVDLDGIEKAAARLPGCVGEYAGSTLPAPSPQTPATRQTTPSGKQEGANKPAVIVRVKAATPEYPLEARRAGREGRAVVKVRFGTSGIPELLIVEKSTGSAALDSAAVDAVKVMRIEPYIVDSKPTPVDVLVPIVFLLSASPPPARQLIPQPAR